MQVQINSTDHECLNEWVACPVIVVLCVYHTSSLITTIELQTPF